MPCLVSLLLPNLINLLLRSVKLAVPNTEVDPKLVPEINGMDLNVLFNDKDILPIKIPLDLPKDLVSIVGDCGIILA